MRVKISLTGTTAKASGSRFSCCWPQQQKMRLLQTLCSPTCLLRILLSSFITLIQKTTNSARTKVCPLSTGTSLNQTVSAVSKKPTAAPHLTPLHPVIPLLPAPCDPSCQSSARLWTRIKCRHWSAVMQRSCFYLILVNWLTQSSQFNSHCWCDSVKRALLSFHLLTSLPVVRPSFVF